MKTEPSELQKRLREELDKKPLSEIEVSATSAQAEIREGQKVFYEMLYYLNFTKRFKENVQYKKAPWEIYLRDTFKISAATYRNMIAAFFKFPKESKVLGAGLVTTVNHKCGAEKTAIVLQKIMKLKKKTHPNIQKVIDSNLRPSETARQSKPTYSALERINAALKVENRALIQENSELKDRISNLLNTVSSFRDDFDFEAHNVPAEGEKIAAMA